MKYKRYTVKYNRNLILKKYFQLYEDVDLLQNVVESSHDIHNQLIDVRQTRLFSRTKEWLQMFTNNIYK